MCLGLLSSIRAAKKSEVGSTSDLTCACGMSIQIKKTKAPKNEKRRTTSLKILDNDLNKT